MRFAKELINCLGWESVQDRNFIENTCDYQLSPFLNVRTLQCSFHTRFGDSLVKPFGCNEYTGRTLLVGRPDGKGGQVAGDKKETDLVHGVSAVNRHTQTAMFIGPIADDLRYSTLGQWMWLPVNQWLLSDITHIRISVDCLHIILRTVDEMIIWLVFR